MSKNSKVIMSGSAILVAILALLLIATPASSGSEVPIAQLYQNSHEFEGRNLTTEGFLIDESVEWDADAVELRFDIQDENGVPLSVYHHGVRPDNFSDDVIIIVHGQLDETETFIADKIQTRCPSTYEAEDPEDYDPDFHRQIDIELHSEE